MITARRLGLVTVTAAGLLPTIGCGVDVPAAIAQVSVERRCSLVDEHGMGIVTDNGHILTSAHVVAGHTNATVEIDSQTQTATVVGFDPDNDLAYLALEKPIDHGWALSDLDTILVLEPNTPASVYVARDDMVTRLDATVVRRIQIETEDIYIEDDVVRPGWEIQYPIEPGDSGGPVIVDGRVIGVIWARSRNARDRAYAIDPVRGGELMEEQLSADRLDLRPDIDVTRC